MLGFAKFKPECTSFSTSCLHIPVRCPPAPKEANLGDVRFGNSDLGGGGLKGMTPSIDTDGRDRARVIWCSRHLPRLGYI
jgi:hypothetical protein